MCNTDGNAGYKVIMSLILLLLWHFSIYTFMSAAKHFTSYLQTPVCYTIINMVYYISEKWGQKRAGARKDIIYFSESDKFKFV